MYSISTAVYSSDLLKHEYITSVPDISLAALRHEQAMALELREAISEQAG